MDKIVESFWFTGITVIGIVVIEDDIGKRKAYIGLGYGDDQKRDERIIAERGAPVDAYQLERLLCQMKGLPC